jgi:hypothetical protein
MHITALAVEALLTLMLVVFAWWGETHKPGFPG